DDDDGVIDDDTDRQNQPEQRQVVQAEADGRHGGEGADDGDGDGDQGDDGGAPALEEDQHDDGDEDDALDQGADDLADRLLDEGRHVQGDDVVDVLGEALLQLLHLDADALGDGDRVGVGQREDRQAAVGPAVHLAGRVQVAGAQLGPPDVLEPDVPAL